MRAWKERRPLLELLAADPSVTERLAPAELKACFDPAWFVRNVDTIFRRAGLVDA
jgi:adenylosuccinate lyase